MFLDALTMVSNAQALTATALSDKSIDLGPVARRAGTGEPMAFVVQVDVAADHTTGNETYQIDVVQSDNADLSSADVLESRIISYVDLTAGATHYIDLPAAVLLKRYVGLQYTLGGTTPSLTVTAALQPKSMIEGKTIHAVGFSVL
jgi:hypothetical protein